MALKPFTGELDPATPVESPVALKPFDGTLDGETPKRTIGGTIGDLGVTALKGAVALPQAAAGLASIATGGLAGKGLETIGVRFDDAQKFLDTQYSDAQQAAQKRVQDADGFVGTAKAMLQNPSTIATAAGESLPSMFAGGAMARGLGLAARFGPAATGAIGEGIMGAGSAAEQVRTQTADRELTAGQAGLAALSGVGTAAFGALGGKVAQRMGIGDVDTMIAQGAAKTAGQPAQRSTIAQMAGGALSEGVLEELPQSLQEQALQNVALGKPWDEGLGKTAAQGLIVGGAMGAAGGGIGSIGNRRELAQEQAAIDRARAAAADSEAKTEQYLRDNPHAGWAAEQGTLTPEMVGPMPQGPQAPDISTAAGAGAPRDGVDFERQVDTSGLSLVDTARADREAAQAARHTTDFTVEDTTPAWSTAAGAAPVRAPAIDVPQEYDTGTLGFEQNLKPSQLMGIDPAAGPLSAAAATAVDSGASNGATADVRPESAGSDRSGSADAGAGMDAGLGSRDGTGSLSQRAGTDRALLGAVASDASASAPNPSVARAPLARDGRLTVTPGEDGLLRNARGEPFTKAQARMAAKQNGGGLEPVEVDGGFALAKVEPNSTTALAQSAPSAIDSEAPASTETAPKNEASSAELTRAVPANDAENQSVAGSPANVIAPAAGNQAPAPVASDAAAAQVVPAARPAGVEAAGVAPNIEPTNSLARTASWVIREKATGAVVMETFDRKKVDALNTAKYEAVPVEQHLASINATALSEQPAGRPEQQGVAARAPGQRLGRDSVPIEEGGKAFKTKRAAAEAKKLQPMMRVVPVDGGYALAEKTPAQLAAEVKAARRLSVARAGTAGMPIAAHEFIATNGGLSRDVAADLGVEGNPRIGNRTLYAVRGKGMSLERATEALSQAGYIEDGDQGAALDMIRRSLTQPQYTTEGWQQLAEVEDQVRYQDHLAAQQDAAQAEDFDPFAPIGEYTQNDLAADPEYGSATDEQKAKVRALLERAESLGIDTEAIQEDVANQTASERAYYDRIENDLSVAISGRAGGDSARATDQDGRAGSGATGQEGDRNSRPVDGEAGRAQSAEQLARDRDIAQAREDLADLETQHKKARGVVRKNLAQRIERLRAAIAEQEALLARGAPGDDVPFSRARRDAGTDDMFGAAAVQDTGLVSYTETDLRQRDAERKQADAAEQRKNHDDQLKTKADAERGDFTLTGSDRPADVAEARGQQAMFSRSSDTQKAYEARIDALFNGAKANLEGARVLDRSDVLGLLGMGEKPLLLAEGKVISGQQTHPRMTAEVWKKVPGWIEDPAAVFKSDTDGGLVFIAPEAIGGAPVSIIVRPDAGKPNTLRAHVLLNAYDRSSATPFTRWINDGLLQFADSKKFPALFETTSGRRLPGTALQNKPGTPRILTEKNLAGWRRENNPALSRSGRAQTLGNANPRAQYEAEWVANVERAAATIKAGWKNAPDVIVIAGMQDEKVPEAVRRADAAQRSQGAQGQPEGFFYNGKVYLVATELPMVRDVARVMFHETLGHFGLRGVFGDALNKQLNLLALNRRADVIRQAREYGLHGLSDKAVNTASDAEVWASMTQQHRMHAAEEVLAFLAQEQPGLSIVQRAVAAIRTWLRENIPSLAMGDMTDAEVVNRFIIPARGWVERGRQSRVDGMPAFGRATNQPMATNNVAGQDQGGAPAGDNMGAPMTLFHGGKAVLSSLGGRGRKNRFLYTTPTEAMAKEYGQHVTRLVPDKDARIADLSDPEALYGSQTAVQAIQQYAQENDIDPDDLVAAVADGRAWETYGEYMQDDINDVVGAALGADIVALPDSTFASNPQVQGKTFVVLDKSKVKITNEPSASGGSGAMFSRAATAQPGQRTQTAPSQPGAKWAMPEPSRFDSAVYKMQDKYVDTLRVIQEIEKAGKAIADDQNIRLQEELYHGRSAKRVNDFAENELKPVLEYMRGAGLTMADVEEYLHARHAREANAVIAAREPSMPDGGSGMTNAAADAYMKALPADQRAKLEKAAEGVDAIIAGTRDLYVAYGLESQSVTDGWKRQFKHYVPLMREDKDGGMGIGQGFSIKGKEVKGRTGSTRKVVDIFSNIAMQRERVIVRGEKNRVAQAAVKLAEANPNTDFWTVDKVPTTRVHDPKTNTVVDQPDTMFKQRENVLVAKFVQPDGSVIERAVVFDPDNERAVRMAGALKNLDAQQLEGMLAASAKVTRYFAAVNTQWNPVFGVVNIVRDVQGALVNLQSTPLAGQQATIAKHTASALMGIYADLRAARGGKKGNSQWAQLFEQFQQDGGQTGYRDQFATSADRAEAMERVLNPEAWAKSGLGRVISAGGTLTAPMEQVRKTLAPVFNWLTDYNDSMENAVRLAAYKTALDRGISRQQAASIAKNLTVNFNRKGQAATHAGALYAFFNAAMQGSARIGQALFTMDGGDVKTIRLSKTGKQVILGGVLLGGLQALALAAAGFDDEDPPEFVRERSLIIPFGGKNYVTIPMPLGLHVIPGLGRHAMEFALSGGKDPAKRLISMAGMFADAFNPIGNAGLSMQTLAPTVLDPLAALTENKDFTGKDIARKSMNKAMPGHMQGKDTSTWLGKMIAEGINYLSGGNQYRAGVFSPTPDQIDYLAAQVGGGVWRELSKVEQTATTAASGEELAPYKVPLLGRFYGNAKSQASQATAFYAGVDRLNALETEIKNMRKDGHWMEAGQLMRSRPDAPLIDVANTAERRVQELRRQKRELVRQGAEREVVRAKEEQITQVMQRFNETAARLTS